MERRPDDRSPISEHINATWLQHRVRGRIVGTLTILEDIIYIALAALFFLAALYIMIDAVISAHWRSVTSLIGTTLDRFLLVLMLAELLHTLLIFLRTHRFRHQPFLVVGIIAAIRRILVVTAEEAANRPVAHIGQYLWDLGLTTAVVVALTLALRWSPQERGF
ncbi:MAG: phosphate-starvation-inducible PsiE family protein [Thermaerobacter sp.]|nr:phosphate-starvation-inducible PsiE family protein [Thermaerobacter sp.]